MKSARKGFTLIELLVVIGILAVLAVVVFAALNPAGRLADARDTRRWSDANTILTAIHEYLVDNEGYPTGVTTSMAQTQLGSALTGCADDGCGAVDACLDLSTPLAAYLKSVPVDPSLAVDATETHYSIETTAAGIVTITACDAEGSVITVSR